MAKPLPPRPAPRLYLETPVLADADGFKPQLVAALTAGGDIAAVLLRLRDSDERTQINRIKTLAPIVQPQGAALLLDGHADIAVRAGADGVHIDGINRLAEIVERMHPDRIVGAGGLYSRHDSMVAGEAGADYVLFGRDDAKGERASRDDIVEQVDWWAHLFEPPCVAYAAALDEIEPFADAGADFVMVGDAVWNDPRGVQTALADAIKALDQGYQSWLARTEPKAG